MVTVITKAAKLKIRKPMKKTNKPAKIISNIFGNLTLNCPVKNTYAIPYKTRNVPIAITVRAKALQYKVSLAAGNNFTITIRNIDNKKTLNESINSIIKHLLKYGFPNYY